MTLGSNKYLMRWVTLLVVIAITMTGYVLHSITLADNKPLNQPITEDIRVFTPDWGVAATLIMMDNPPIAMGDKVGYAAWFGKPKLPKSIINMGMRGQPNLELLAQIQPDLILDTDHVKEARSLYDPQIPVYEIDFVETKNRAHVLKQWSSYVAEAHRVGEILNKPEQVEDYLLNSKQRITTAGATVRQHIGDNRKVVLVEFWDARELSVYTIYSHQRLAAKMMGLDFITMGSGSYWAQNSVSMDAFYELPEDVCVIIVEPLPVITKYEVAHSSVWQRSPFFKSDACVYKIGPVWVKGGAELLVGFAESLAEAVTTQKPNEFSLEYAASVETK